MITWIRGVWLLTLLGAGFMVASASAADTSAPAVQAGNEKATPGGASARRPNIIYFYADDLGYGETGAYGQKKIRTPNVDRLAAEGMKFTRHYTGTPVCAPARCNLLTGLHSGHAVVRGNYEMGGYTDETEGGQMPLPPHTQTLGTLLKSAGYATACVGKWGLGMTQTSGHPNRQGFDYFFGYLDQKQAHNYYPTHLWENETRYPLNNKFVNVHDPAMKGVTNVNFDRYQTGDHAVDHITSKALTFLEANRDKPFFLYFSTPLPHVSLQPKKEFLEPYLKEFADGTPGALSPQAGPDTDPPFLANAGPTYAPHPHPRAAYAAMISMMDHDLGLLMAKVKELGLDENTIIMFSSDNGPTFDVGGVDTRFFDSAAGRRGSKASVYEGGIIEPMIARWPGQIKAGSVTELMSAQYDVLPTLCDLVDIPMEKPVDGISFLPTLLGKGQQKTHDYFYWEFPERGGQQALTKGDWKIVKQKMRNKPHAAWELYNLKTDPAEQNDLAAAHPDRVKELAELAREAHWHPAVHEWEFVDPKFTTSPE